VPPPAAPEPPVAAPVEPEQPSYEPEQSSYDDDATETAAISLPDVAEAPVAEPSVAAEPTVQHWHAATARDEWDRDEVEAVADSAGANGGEDASRRRRPWWRPGD
jgi:hypothetical protein